MLRINALEVKHEKTLNALRLNAANRALFSRSLTNRRSLYLDDDFFSECIVSVHTKLLLFLIFLCLKIASINFECQKVFVCLLNVFSVGNSFT